MTTAKTESAGGGIGVTLPSSHWMMAPSRLVSTTEMSTAIAEEKKIPTMTPARTARLYAIMQVPRRAAR